MKNIYLLPTTASNSFGFCKRKDNGKLLVCPMSEEDHNQAEYQHVYITSDGKIKEGDWVITPNPQKPLEKINKETYLPHYNKKRKIILTTDPKLIKEGIQAIDDDFLEWFVKNPSCDFVDVIFDFKRFRWSELKDSQCYKIITPKETPEQHVQLINENIDELDESLKKVKQGTLDKAAKANALEELSKYQPNKERFKLSCKNSFLKGAKYEAEIDKEYYIKYIKSEQELQIKKMKELGVNVDGQTFEQMINSLINIIKGSYSEEEVLELLKQCYNTAFNDGYYEAENSPSFIDSDKYINNLLKSIKNK
jgi:hypothetical protein